MQRMLNRYRDDLGVAALPHELTAAAEDTVAFLQSQAARVAIDNVAEHGGPPAGGRLGGKPGRPQASHRLSVAPGVAARSRSATAMTGVCLNRAR